MPRQSLKGMDEPVPFTFTEINLEHHKMTAIDPNVRQSTTPLTSSAIWMLGLYMLIFMFLLGIVHGVLWAVTVVQFIWLVIAQEPNVFLVKFGKSLSIWTANAVRFLTCATDEKPFPWQAWPSSD